MSSSRLRWIIALMTVALAGLVFFQWYWVETVIRANEEGFRKDVLAALDNVVRKLEKQEALYVVNQRLSKSQVKRMDPGNQQINVTSGGESFMYEFNGSQDSAGFNFFFSLDATGGVEVSSSVNTIPPVVRRDFQVGQNRDWPNNEELRSAINKVSNKSEMIVTVLEELMLPRSLTKRYNPQQLDSLLKNELQQHGINIGYEYGVVNHAEARFVTISNRASQQQLINSEFQSAMFPNDVVGQLNILSLYFPNKSKYLMSKLWLTISSSGALVLIILFCFGYAVHTIVKQKNISDMKNDFINNMTHELKTPIATIGLAAEALGDETIARDDAMRGRYMGVIQEENQRLGLQVERVLQMALIDKKQMKFVMEEVDLHEVVKKAIAKISVQLESRKGHLSSALEATTTVIKADEGHLLNIILNLLDNAIKYSEDDPKIMLRTKSNRAQIIFSIKDHGIGMNKEELKHIFQQFYRVPTGNLHDVKGFGLGLTYVKSVVDTLGGQIEVESDQQKGTNFTIKFPLSNG